MLNNIVVFFLTISASFSARAEKGTDVFEGWLPKLTNLEKASIEKSAGVWTLKPATSFKGVLCPSGAEIMTSGKKSILLITTAESYCYLDSEGDAFTFKGKVEIEKKSNDHIVKLKKYIEKVKKHGFQGFEFVFGYDNDLNARMKNAGVILKSYIASNLIPNANDNILQATTLEAQSIKSLYVPAKSQVVFSKDNSNKDVLGSISNESSPIAVNDLSCEDVWFPSIGSVNCRITQEKKVNDTIFPKATVLEVSADSVAKGKVINVISARNSSREIKVGNETVPKNSKIVFSNGSHKVIPPEDSGN